MRVSSIRLALSASVAVLALVSPAAAQTVEPAGQQQPPVAADDATAANDDIVVTGIRRSLETAAAAKRDAATISDVISSEDIGKFPDQNLAESLQRVTGVQITRNKGEGASVSVRGLSPDFTRTQYNGRTIPTPNGGRSFSFTSLSSDFVSAVEVVKSPTADMIDGGLSATVNVKVARPLDLGANRTALTAEGIYETNPRKASPHLAAYTNRVFADGKIGIDLGVNWERRYVVQSGYTAYGVETRAETPSSPALDYNRDGLYTGTYKFDHATTIDSQEGTFNRLTFIGGIQVKPADGVDLYADGFYSKFRDHYDAFEHQLRWTNIGGPTAAIRNSVVADGNFLSVLDADGVDHRGDHRDVSNRDQVFSSAVGGSFTTGALKLSSEFTYSRAKRRTDYFAFAMIGRASASYDLRGGYDVPPLIAFNRGFNPLDASTFSILNINGADGATNTNRNYDGRADAVYTFDGGLLKALKAGVYTSNMRTAFRSASFNIPASVLAGALGVPYRPTVEGGSIAATNFLMQVDRTRFLPGPLGVYLVPDYAKVFARTTLDDLLALSPVLAQPARDYSVTERSIAGYVRADFGTMDDRLTGNVGVRYVRTRQTSAGAAPDLSQAYILRGGIQTIIPSATPVAIRNDYAYVLPSANARFEVAHDLVLRLAVARALTRPDLGLLTPASTIDANVRTINSGNPQLKPYLATQADLSIEYYLRNGGLLSAAAFYKNVDNFVLRTSSVRSVTLRLEEGGTSTFPYRTFQPNNGTTGKIKGLEVGAQVPLTFLPGVLDGLGVIANYTYLDVNDVQTTEGGPFLPLPGVSKNSFNVGGYYEKDGFGARLSYNYRSRFTNDALSYFGDGDFTRGYGQLDASMSYDINRNASLTLDVTNATNAKLTTVNSMDVLRTMNIVGRRFTGGIRLKF